MCAMPRAGGYGTMLGELIRSMNQITPSKLCHGREQAFDVLGA